MPVISIILLICFALYAWLIGYYRHAWRQIPAEQKPFPLDNPPVLSVIIPARNEAKRIGACLDSMVDQHYPPGCYEIIVVDDHSGDETAAIVTLYARRYPFIRCIRLADEIDGKTLNAYKKKAIETGIAHSRGELIVTTDADCTARPNWLSGIASAYRSQSALCLVMPVVIQDVKKTLHLRQRLLAVFQQLDVMTLQGITGASVYKKFHGMCNGANFAYTRQVFYEVGGFEGIDHLASGDDMLLLQKISALYPDQVRYLKSPEVIVETRAEETLNDFFNQRIRWASKSGQYPDKKVLPVLILVYALNLFLLLHILLFIPFIFSGNNKTAILMALIVFILKTCIELSFLIPVARFFNRSALLLWFPVMQLPHILYTVLAGFLGIFGRYRWKGRRVH